MEEQPKPKLTPDGLPVVHEDIGASLLRDHQSGSKYGDLLTKINDENPLVANYISQVALALEQGGASNNVVGGATGGMLFVYELLRSQAEANKLEEMYNGDSSE